VNIVEAIKDERFFRPIFKDLATWQNWLVLLKAYFGLEMTPDEFAVYQKYTGRPDVPKKEFGELWIAAGRRSGKSLMSSVIAVYLALFNDFQKYLSPGERAIIQIIASDRAQAKLILDYVRGIFETNPVFGQYVEQDFREAIHLNNSVSIEVMSCSFRSIRGRSVAAVIFDEIAFFFSDGHKPDSEILAAVRPGLATFGDASKLIAISSPYSRSGVLYEHWERYWGKPDKNVLFWRAPTRIMNPTISQELIDSEMQKDRSAAESEWMASWRSDIEGFLSPDVIKSAAVLPGELAPKPYQIYSAFVDSSGGRQDRYSLGIGHYDYDQKKMVVDLVRGWDPPFDPHKVTQEVSEVCRRYRIHRLTGDRYAARWVSEAFAKHGIVYSNSELSKSKLFLEFEGVINTGQILIPKNKDLINELLNLERRTGRSGRDSVDHAPKGSDDLANSVAGCAYLLTSLKDSAFANCDLT
jgi:hypothetical protein